MLYPRSKQLREELYDPSQRPTFKFASYPKGVITSIDELLKLANQSTIRIWVSSRHWKDINAFDFADEYGSRPLGGNSKSIYEYIKIRKIDAEEFKETSARDWHLQDPKTQIYNDRFVFATEEDARAWINLSIAELRLLQHDTAK